MLYFWAVESCPESCHRMRTIAFKTVIIYCSSLRTAELQEASGVDAQGCRAWPGTHKYNIRETLIRTLL